MEKAEAPRPFAGLAVALVLGVVLAVAAVAVFAGLPASVELTGASSVPAADRQNKTASPQQPANSTQSGANATANFGAGGSYLVYNSSNSLPIGSIASAVSGASSPPTSNETGSQAGNSTYMDATVPTANTQKEAVVSTAFRDVLLFAAAGVLAVTAFFVLRRYMA